LKLIDRFFGEHNSPVDIAIVLYDALLDSHLLGYHLKGNNLLFFRPMASHKRKISEPFLEGEIHPERELLIFDSDAITGNALTETSNYFAGLGYKRQNIYSYLNHGCDWRGGVEAELKQVDDMLRR
jgi:hypothetical protein